jgi:hypothetical protein
MKALITLLIVIGTVPVAGADSVGNGGDPLRFLFDDARISAAARVRSIKACAFSVGVNSEVRDWLMTQKDALADDLMASPHAWITDAQATCAFTQTYPGAPITLSFVTCRSGIHDIGDAVKLLVHESTHHFGISTEQFPDQVAAAVASLGLESTCPVDPAQDPFDPASCPGARLSAQDLMGMIPLPASTERRLGNFELSLRKRTCYGETLCTPWEKELTNFYDWVHFSDSCSGDISCRVIPTRLGSSTLRLVNNIPVMDLVSGDYFESGTIGKRNWWGRLYSTNYDLKTTGSFTSSGSGHGGYIYFGGDTLGNIAGSAAANTTGWITRTCLRQTFAHSQKAKDANGNDVRNDYEAVALSPFFKP